MSNCTPDEIAAITLALKHKDDLSQLINISEDIDLQEGLSIGAVWVVYEVARGMTKSAQIDQMPQGIHYITAITKPQIDKLIAGGIIQVGLFDDRVFEVQSEGIRYILRRNPYLEVDEAVLVEKSKIAGNLYERMIC